MLLENGSSRSVLLNHIYTTEVLAKCNQKNKTMQQWIEILYKEGE